MELFDQFMTSKSKLSIGFESDYLGNLVVGSLGICFIARNFSYSNYSDCICELPYCFKNLKPFVIKSTITANYYISNQVKSYQFISFNLNLKLTNLVPDFYLITTINLAYSFELNLESSSFVIKSELVNNFHVILSPFLLHNSFFS